MINAIMGFDLKKVLTRRDLSSGDKITLLALMMICDDGMSKITHFQLAIDSGLSTPTINTSIKSLENKEIISIERSKNFGVSNSYRILDIGVSK